MAILGKISQIKDIFLSKHNLLTGTYKNKSVINPIKFYLYRPFPADPIQSDKLCLS